jgi:hypothetical protein
VRGVAHLVGEGHETADEGHAARDAPRAQRLRLPRQRPAPVVLGVRVERSHERAVATLGAQVRVEVERNALVLGVAAPATSWRDSSCARWDRCRSRRRRRARRHRTRSRVRRRRSAPSRSPRNRARHPRAARSRAARRAGSPGS